MNDAPHSLSVLFATVSGNARLHEKLGGAETLRAVERCRKRMERAIDGFGGRIVKAAGDEVMAVFNLADEAFQAAVEMQQRVADLPPVSGVKLAIRIGFSHGPVSESADGLTGETVKTAALLAGLAQPEQVLTSVQARGFLSPAMRRSTRALETLAANGAVYELVAPDASAPAAKLSTPQGTRLCLRYGGRDVNLDDGKQVIQMGRDAESDVVINDRRASRNHAQIERRGDRIMLIDTSTNGTFITLPGQPELFVRHEECVLHGKGVISFAASASSPDADCAEFEQL